MSYHIPEDVIAKAHLAYKNSVLPGQDAMASALRAIKDDLWVIIKDEIEFQNAVGQQIKEIAINS